MKKLFFLLFVLFISGCTISCDNVFFTHSPISVSEISSVIPLGLISASSHILPTDHIYFSINHENGSVLVAPGDITITSISLVPHGDLAPDYTISFVLCNGVSGYFHHVNSLSNEVKAFFDNSGCEDECLLLGYHEFSAGTPLGVVGLNGHNQFDLGVLDFNINYEYINQRRYSGDKIKHSVCPFDYYESEMKETLYDLLDGPNCGTIYYDVQGSVQGSWFLDEGGQQWDETKALSFINYTFDDSRGFVGIGGYISETKKWSFQKKHSGYFNRDFSETRVGEMYCYHSDELSEDGWLFDERLLLELIDNTTLKVEVQEGLECDEPYDFVNPWTYYR